MSIGRLQTSPSDSRRRFDDECNYFFFLSLCSLFRGQRAKVTRSPFSRFREKGREGGRRPIQGSLLRYGCLLYKSFAKVRQFAFSSRQRCGGGTGTDNISTFYPALPLFFSPFSLLHNIFFALRSFLTFLPLFPSLFFKMTRGSRSIFLCEFVVA